MTLSLKPWSGPLRRIRAAAVIGLALVCLTACGTARNVQALRQLDLGAGPGSMNKMALPQNPPLVVPPAAAAALLQEQAVVWRVGLAGQPQVYATYQWTSSPAKLVVQRLTERLALQGAVLQQAVGADLPQLRLHLLRFEQSFSEDGASSVGVLSLQAVLVKDGQVQDQKFIDLQVLAKNQDAPGGAQALREATDQAAEQVAKWLSDQLKR